MELMHTYSKDGPECYSEVLGAWKNTKNLVAASEVQTNLSYK